MKDVEGKVAFVTGGGSGVGLGMAKAFLGAGMKVVIADIRADHLEAATAELGGDVHAIQLDVTDREAFARAADETEQILGNVHVLCNNAGINLFNDIADATYQDWDWVLGVNLGGVVHGIAAFVPGMVERGEPGHVVNTASLGGLVAFPGLAPYTAAKYAVVGLSECLEHDLRAQDVPIGVSVLCPGPVLSSLRENSRILRPGGGDDSDIPLMTDVPRTPAADVAAQVVDAMRSDRFWILTHPAYNQTIRARCRGIVDTDALVVPQLL
jgi:NADP-dependent 3-hydroxy acid dehydrogenase YdfG